MKRALLPILLLLSLSSLLARPTLVVETAGQGSSYALLGTVVRRVGEQSLLSRMDGDGELSVLIGEVLSEEENSLSANLLFTYGERTLELCLSADDARNLEKELERRLTAMLLYDALALMEAEPSPVVDYTYATGYASRSILRKGSPYKGVDAQGKRWGSAMVQHVGDESDPLSLLAGTGGAALLPGMRLVELQGRAVELAFFGMLASPLGLGLDLSYSQDIGLYPFSLVVGGGLDFQGEGLSLSSLYGRAGFVVAFPLSAAFGLQSGFWRNSTLAMECTLGLGYSLVDSLLLYGSSALFTYRYHLGGYSLALGLGNRHWVTSEESYRAGLFMRLGLAYTW